MRPIGRKVFFWAILLALPTAAFILSVGVVSYWTIAPAYFRAEVGPIIIYDPEIGFVPESKGIARKHG